MSESLVLLAQNPKITNWLTPFWIFSSGAAAGFVLVLLFLALIMTLSKVGGLNRIYRNRPVYLMASIVLGMALSALAVWGLVKAYGAESLMDASGTVLNEQGGGMKPAAMPAAILAVIASFVVAFGFWRLISDRFIDEVRALVSEGFLRWVRLLLIGLTVFSVAGIVLGLANGFGIVKFVEDPRGILQSVARLPVSGDYFREVTVPPTPFDASGERFSLQGDAGQASGFRFTELEEVAVLTNQVLQVSFEKFSDQLTSDMYFQIPAGNRPFRLSIDLLKPPEGEGDSLFIANRGTEPATVQVAWRIQPEYPQAAMVVWVAAFVLGMFVLILSLSVLAPKISAISLSTFKTEVSQPIYLVAMALTAVFIMFSIWLPYNTLGEDIKMYKDSALTMLRVVGIFVAIWAASKSVAEEIEGRTALTVLSKPVGRRQFILGKIFGISLAMALMFIVLGIWFFVWTAYKPIYDAREMSAGAIEWPLCYMEAMHMAPAILLAFMEVVIFVAISVAISTRMGILANLMICFAIYVLGHLTSLLVITNELSGAFDTVKFFGNFIALVFPVLVHFDVQTAINTNTPIPWIYLGWAFIYTMLYGSVAVLLSLVFFEDRDLA